MEIRETAATAFDALLSNKLRTGLAVLGIVIGISAVVSLLALGQGAQQAVTSRITSLGSNLLTISPGAASQRGVRGAAGTASTLTLEDARAIVSAPSVTTVSAVSAEVSRNFQVTYGRANTNTRVTGTLPTYTAVRNITMAQGVFLSERDVTGLSKVAILGPQVAADLFGAAAAPVGQIVQINRIGFRIIGVTEAKGGSGFFNQDDIIYIPVTTAQKVLMGTTTVNNISVAAISAEVMDQATQEIGLLLLSRHGLRTPEEADFTIRSQADILSAVTEATGTFTALLSGIAAISLLVGGIGIMNVMLVTIAERTREIGIRKAIGAKRRDILSQFLIESVVLTVVGGALGVLLGWLLSFVAGRLLNIPIGLTLSAPLLAFGVSSAIGIIFGYYPARRAARMQPINALRYE